MVNKRKGRTARLGVLSEDEVNIVKEADNRDDLIKERDSLALKESNTKTDKKRIKEINRKLKKISTRLSVLVKDLDKRIGALGPQLILIAKSQSLAPFVRMRDKEFFGLPYKEEGAYEKYGIMTTYGEIQNKMSFETSDGTEPIPDFSRWKVEYKGSPRVYWLNTNVSRDITIKNIFRPEFAMSGIKGIWNIKSSKYVDEKESVTIEKINAREIIKEALSLEKRYQGMIKDGTLQEIIPRTQEYAISIQSIIDNSEKFKVEIRKLQDDELRALMSDYFPNFNDNKNKKLRQKVHD